MKSYAKCKDGHGHRQQNDEIAKIQKKIADAPLQGRHISAVALIADFLGHHFGNIPAVIVVSGHGARKGQQSQRRTIHH